MALLAFTLIVAVLLVVRALYSGRVRLRLAVDLALLIAGVVAGGTFVASHLSALPSETEVIVVALAVVVLCLFVAVGFAAWYARELFAAAIAEVTRARADARLIHEELTAINDQIGEYAHRQLAREARAARLRLEAAQDDRADAQERIDVATVIDEEKARGGLTR